MTWNQALALGFIIGGGLGFYWGRWTALKAVIRSVKLREAQTQIPLEQRMRARPVSKEELEAKWRRNGKTPEQEYGHRVLQQYPHGRAGKK